MNLLKAAINNYQVTLSLSFIILLAGVHSLLNMSRREDPKFNVRQGLVVAFYPGATSLEVEQQVTNKIEELLFSFEEVRKTKTTSTSRRNVCFVVIELESNVTDGDKFWSKLQHQLNLTKELSLPKGVIGPIVDSGFGDTIALLLGIQSSERDNKELQSIMTDIENGLRTIPSVSKIKRIGGKKEKIFVTADLKKLSQYNLSLSQLFLAVQGENNVFPNGELEIGPNNLALETKGLYTSISDIENQIIFNTPIGGIVRVKDVASVERKFESPNQMTRINGQDGLFLSIEMHEGNNIVDFGELVDEKLAGLKRRIPPDVQLTTLVNQPKQVESSVSRFIEEFLIAIVSVVLVTIFLLPLRVALITALAIPITVALTFFILDSFGIELHQVSLASLIVVLGMLVDDAIVIADNYLEKLDEGLSPYEAAWQSAEELKVPVFTAGMTIIGSFAPLVILSGYVGEFIVSLPITVAISITCSYLVAMLLTPLLCFYFIKKGLSKKISGTKKKKFSLLDGLQNVYNHSIGKAFKYPYITIGIGILSIVLGAVFFQFLKDKFFPVAERNQFVVELFLPEGTNISTTDSASRIVEEYLQKDERLVSQATFVGTSSPRFYYNFAPKFPQENYAQILINTPSNEVTVSWVKELENSIHNLLPEGRVLVRQMQQGVPTEAPVEVRIVGKDINQLKKIGKQVTNLMHAHEDTYLVETDFKNDYFGISVKAKEGIANRIGISNADISRVLAVGFSGIPISKYWEGKYALDIEIREKESARDSFEDLTDTYINSPITGKRLPLREIAEINPGWQTSNIKHRNGVRTITAMSQARSNVFPSEILKEIMPEIEKIDLPDGYSIEFGGEYESKQETFSEMTVALTISLFIIFMTMLLQFRKLKDVFIVISAIPLCIFGAMLGLLLSGYPFGFTAFVGLASLAGVTVRNSIILVDYANFLIEKERKSAKEAAILAGERRIRPIFLTTMAAAVGVTPMIISGSQLWAPLATVIAVGLIFSMFMTLVIVPVLYFKLLKNRISSKGKTIAGIVIFFISVVGFPEKASAQELMNLDIDSAISMAKNNNKLLRAAYLQVREKELEAKKFKKLYLPKVKLNSSVFYWYNTRTTTDMEISLVDLPLIGGVPPINLGTQLTVPENSRFAGYLGLGIYQPITQIAKIKTGEDVANNEVILAQNSYQKAVDQATLGVVKLYLGVLIEEAKINEAKTQIAFAESRLNEIKAGVNAGELERAYQMGLEADVMEKETKIFEAENKKNYYADQLKDLLEIPKNNSTNLKPIEIEEIDSLLESISAQIDYSGNVEILSAKNTLQKAELGVRAAKNEYIPDLSFFAQGLMIRGLPVIPENNILVGLNLNWTIFSFGEKKAGLELSKIRAEQALLSFENKNAEIDTKVANLENEITLAKKLLETAKKAKDFREEELRVKKSALQNGMIDKKDYYETSWKLEESKRMVLEAEMNLVLKYNEILLEGK